MKKVFAAVLCLMFVLSMALSGCQFKDPLVGTWKGTVDLTEIINTELSAVPGMSGYFSFQDLTLDIIVTFDEEGICTMSADPLSQIALTGKLAEQVGQGVSNMLQQILTSYGSDMSVEEFLQNSNTTMDELLQESMDEFMPEDLFEQMSLSVQYKAEDGKLYIREDLNDPFDAYLPYTLEGWTLTLQKGPGMDDVPYAQMLFPLVLKKIG